MVILLQSYNKYVGVTATSLLSVCSFLEQIEELSSLFIPEYKQTCYLCVDQ